MKYAFLIVSFMAFGTAHASCASQFVADEVYNRAQFSRETKLAAILKHRPDLYDKVFGNAVQIEVVHMGLWKKGLLKEGVLATTEHKKTENKHVYKVVAPEAKPLAASDVVVQLALKNMRTTPIKRRANKGPRAYRAALRDIKKYRNNYVSKIRQAHIENLPVELRKSNKK